MIPGLVAAIFFHQYLIAGILTLLLLPLAFLVTWSMFLKQRKLFKEYGLIVRKNILGFVWYMLVYQIIMTPASFTGYIAEIFNFKKTWGTK
jgi:biofilm PGA synthesis N-glycosyltransferase PgaC